MGSDFVLVPGVFIDVGGNQDRKAFFTRWQRNRAPHLSARALGSVYYFLSRHIN